MVSGSNSAALRLIESWPDWPSPVALLTGPSGSGKTHLVHIWAARAGAEIIEAAALRLEYIPQLGTAGALAVEDVEPAAVPEEPLFHLFNSVREHGGSLLVTSQAHPEEWNVVLPDLRSRLRLATPLTLGAPEDALLRQVLVKLFADRQLLVDKPVIDYLIARMERSLRAAVRLVDALDRASLSAGRRITRQTAAGILAESQEIPAESRDIPEAFADRQ